MRLWCALVAATCRSRWCRRRRLHRATHDYPVKPVPFTAVHISDTFWAPRIR